MDVPVPFQVTGQDVLIEVEFFGVGIAAGALIGDVDVKSGCILSLH